MKFKATDEQIAHICCNAYNASTPVGMGLLHYSPVDLTPEDFMGEILHAKSVGWLHLDYVRGRMVKLDIHFIGDEWQCTTSLPRGDYQSWTHAYPTYDALIESVLGKQN